MKKIALVALMTAGLGLGLSALELPPNPCQTFCQAELQQCYQRFGYTPYCTNAYYQCLVDCT